MCCLVPVWYLSRYTETLSVPKPTRVAGPTWFQASQAGNSVLIFKCLYLSDLPIN